MSRSTSIAPPTGVSRLGVIGATVLLSAGLHLGGLAAASRLEPRRPPHPPPVVVDFEVVAPPPPPAAPPPPPPEAPEPVAPRRVAVKSLPPPPKTPPPPPPPNVTPPPSEPPARAAPRVGVSLGSTTTGGSFAVGVGNTLYGKADEVAADPKAVKPYAVEGTAPPRRSSAQPKLLRLVEPPYPPAARKAAVEGPVVLLLRIDARGRVVAARVVSEPGTGTGEAARAALLRSEWSPALLEGEAVETEIRFTYNFVLE